MEHGRLMVQPWESRDGRSLAAFRVMFGLLMAASSLRALGLGWIRAHIIEPSFHFTYPGFGWVKPLPGDGPIYLTLLLAVVALLLAAGVASRAMAALLCLGLTYEFLLERALYLNHMYLSCLLALMLVVVPSDAAYTLAHWRKKKPPGQVPAWSLWLLKGQLLLVYVYSGVSKLQPDWLSLMPLRMTFSHYAELPYIGALLNQGWLLALVGYGIVAIELLAPLLLFKRRTRTVTMALLVSFHIATAIFYQIGIFPWLCLAALTLFLPPDWPTRRAKQTPPGSEPAPDSESAAASESARYLQPTPRRKRLILAGLASYALVQALLPLRSWLSPGDPSWTHTGHAFAWRLLLSHRSGWARFVVFDPETGARDTISPYLELTPLQAQKMATHPEMLRMYANHLGAQLRAKGRSAVQVRVESGASLNGRAIQPLIDSRVDLAGEPFSFGRPQWIVPLTQPRPAQPTRWPQHYFSANMWGAPALYREAQRLHREGKLQEAVDAYRKFLLVQPDSSSGRLNLASVLRSMKRHQQAHELLVELVASHPERPEAWLELAIALLNLRRPQEAADALQRGLQRHPEDRQLLALATRLKRQER